MPPRRTKNLLRPSVVGTVNVGSDYTDDEREFLVAIERYKRHVTPFPTWREVLAVLLDLGWQPPPKRE